MAELSTIARPYADAFFAATAPADRAAALLEIETLAAIATNPDVMALASNPGVTDSHLIEVMRAGFKSSLSANGERFLSAVIANGRVSALPAVAQQFRLLKNAAEGNADALIESAFPVTDREVADLMAALEKKFAIKLKPHVSINPALIGGVKVTVGDQVLDTSIQAQLEQMRIALTA